MNRARALISGCFGKIWSATGIPYVINTTTNMCLQRGLFLLAALVRSLPEVMLFFISAYFSLARFFAANSAAPKWIAVLGLIVTWLFVSNRIFDRYQSLSETTPE